MASTPFWNPQRRGLASLVLIVLVILFLYGRHRIAKVDSGELVQSRKAENPGGYVYIPKGQGKGTSKELEELEGRPGRLDKFAASGTQNDTVAYRVEIEDEEKKVEVPHKILLRCPAGQGDIDDHWKGVTRIWNGSDTLPLREQTIHQAQFGDTVTVEIKDLDRWVFQQFDYGRLKEELNSVPKAFETAVRDAVEARRAEELLACIIHINHLLRDRLQAKPKRDAKAEELAAFQKRREETWKTLVAYIKDHPVLDAIHSAKVDEDKLDGDGDLSEKNIYTLERRFLPLKVWSASMTQKCFKQLTLVINGIALAGATPENDYNEAEAVHAKRPSFPEDLIQWARFDLKEAQLSPTASDREAAVARENINAWERLIGKPALKLRAPVTLRWPEQDLQLPSRVIVKSGHHSDGDLSDDDRETSFALIGISLTECYEAACVYIVVLLCLLWLARTTNILRDSSERVRPDGLEPVSLGRTQMALWFILIAFSYTFIWVTTKRHGTINDTCLILLGIGSGTALGSALIESSARKFSYVTKLDTARDEIEPGIIGAILDCIERLFPLLDADDPRRSRIVAILRRIKAENPNPASDQVRHVDQLIEHFLGQLSEQLRASEPLIKTSADAAMIALARELTPAPSAAAGNPGTPTEETTSRQVVAEELALLAQQHAAFRNMPKSAWKRLFADWFSEGSANTYSFHRFQMLAWTLILGLIFMVDVARDRAMPTFDTNTLLLLGISAGTYLGFKIPAAKKL